MNTVTKETIRDLHYWLIDLGLPNDAVTNYKVRDHLEALLLSPTEEEWRDDARKAGEDVLVMVTEWFKGPDPFDKSRQTHLQWLDLIEQARERVAILDYPCYRDTAARLLSECRQFPRMLMADSTEPTIVRENAKSMVDRIDKLLGQPPRFPQQAYCDELLARIEELEDELRAVIQNQTGADNLPNLNKGCDCK